MKTNKYLASWTIKNSKVKNGQTESIESDTGFLDNMLA